MRALLVGNYGVGNWGDEALRERFLSRFPDVHWTVLTAHPSAAGDVPRLPCGIRSFLQLDWLRTLRAFRSADAMVLGGGTLFTDIESPLACVLWSLHVAAARFFRVPVYAAGQGIGPFRTWLGEALARWSLRRCVFVSVRDDASATRAESFQLNSKIVRSFDPVLLSILPKIEERSKNVLLIVPRANSTDAFQKIALAEARSWHGLVRVLLFEPGDLREREWAKQFAAAAQRDTQSIPLTSTAAVLAACADAGRMVTQRFHGGIVALGLGIPFVRVPQHTGDKLDRLPEASDQEHIELLRTLARHGEDALEAAMRR